MRCHGTRPDPVCPAVCLGGGGGGGRGGSDRDVPPRARPRGLRIARRPPGGRHHTTPGPTPQVRDPPPPQGPSHRPTHAPHPLCIPRPPGRPPQGPRRCPPSSAVRGAAPPTEGLHKGPTRPLLRWPMPYGRGGGRRSGALGPRAHGNGARHVVDGLRTEARGQRKQSHDPRNNQHNPQYANYWAPLTRKRHIPPHSAQPQHTNDWAPRTRKRHQQEHRPQRPTERSDPTQHAKGRAGDCPGPRKEATTRRNVTWGGGGYGM